MEVQRVRPPTLSRKSAVVLAAVLVIGVTACGSGAVTSKFTLSMPSGPCTPATLSGVVTNDSGSSVSVNPAPEVHLGGQTYSAGGSGTCTSYVTSSGSGGTVTLSNPSSAPSATPVLLLSQHSFQFTTPYWIPASMCGKHGWLTSTGIGRVGVTFSCATSG